MAKTNVDAPSDVGIKTTSMIGGGTMMSGSKEDRAPSKRRYVKRIEIEPAKGGMTIRHHYGSGADMPYKEPQDHVFTKDQFDDEVVPHLRKHLGINRGAKADSAEPDGADDAGE